MNSTILIAEPGYNLRRRLSTHFDGVKDYPLIYEVATEEELRYALSSRSWDLIVVNQSLITDFAIFPQEHFIVLATKWNIKRLYDAYSYGARGYFSEDAPKELFQMALVSPEGSFLIEPVMTKTVIEHFADRGRFVIQNDLLTPREREIMNLLRDGLNRRSIAQKLCISETTLKTHIKNVTRKRKSELSH